MIRIAKLILIFPLVFVKTVILPPKVCIFVEIYFPQIFATLYLKNNEFRNFDERDVFKQNKFSIHQYLSYRWISLSDLGIVHVNSLHRNFNELISYTAAENATPQLYECTSCSFLCTDKHFVAAHIQIQHPTVRNFWTFCKNYSYVIKDLMLVLVLS